jgi:hypothetical protein
MTVAEEHVVSIMIPYCYLGDTTSLENCLKSLNKQRQACEIIVCDDSNIADRELVIDACNRNDVKTYIEFPFVDFKPQFSSKFNQAAMYAQGDMLMILCSNWVLGENTLFQMVDTLNILGKNAMLSGDNARQHMRGESGEEFDWWQGQPTLFEITNGDGRAQPSDYVDEGFLTVLRKENWLVWDEEFDKVGAWHAVVEWGYRLLQSGVRHYIRRDLEAVHQERTPRPEWLDQTAESDILLRSKLGR